MSKYGFEYDVNFVYVNYVNCKLKVRVVKCQGQTACHSIIVVEVYDKQNNTLI